ncbi:succinate dehydrogenase assembly factor 2 [Methylocella sp.]|uniref:succinate dehydrogenase assembly factor 2 n=1 Tax=Methylocella sp. TaxID=1978226 RepID=UPI003784E1A9
MAAESPQTAGAPNAAPLDSDARRRRIRFRAWHRGMLENDLLLGRFADAEVATLTDAELDVFDALLEAIDRDVFAWATGEAPVPAEFDTPLFRRIVAFHDRFCASRG